MKGGVARSSARRTAVCLELLFRTPPGALAIMFLAIVAPYHSDKGVAILYVSIGVTVVYAFAHWLLRTVLLTVTR